MVFISNAKNVAQSKWARTQRALLGIGTVLHITQWTKYINPLHAYESYIRQMARVTLWFYSEFYLNLEVHAGFLSSQATELKISTVVTCQ